VILVPSFESYDGTALAYREVGDGPPVVCVPGGPGRSVEYLSDLGGVSGSRRLVLSDLRGVGGSADPLDPETLRVDRLVHDVEALRAHLGLDRIDLLAHSAGAVLAVLYAAAHPDRVSRLVLVTPGLGALGLGAGADDLAAALERSAAEPWHADAVAALDQLMTGDLSIEAFRASRPLFYSRWDGAAQAHAMLGVTERHLRARMGYFAGVSVDVAANRAAMARLPAPVLLYGGELDPLVPPAVLTEAAPLFHDATVVVQPAAAHFPWVDDPVAFARSLGPFLG
jgi:pimeloyl-ACP methyl ester carboxylesterase